MKDAVIVSIARTAVGKAYKGALATVRPDDMAAVVINEILKRAPGIDPKEIDDVIWDAPCPRPSKAHERRPYRFTACRFASFAFRNDDQPFLLFRPASYCDSR